MHTSDGEVAIRVDQTCAGRVTFAVSTGLEDAASAVGNAVSAALVGMTTRQTDPSPVGAPMSPTP